MAKRSPGSRRERGQHPRARPSGAGGPGTAARGAQPRPACRVPGRPPLRLGTAPPEVASACEGSGTCDPWPWGARAACASLSVWGTARLRGAPWGSVMRGFGGCSEYRGGPLARRWAPPRFSGPHGDLPGRMTDPVARQMQGPSGVEAHGLWRPRVCGSPVGRSAARSVAGNPGSPRPRPLGVVRGGPVLAPGLWTRPRHSAVQ